MCGLDGQFGQLGSLDGHGCPNNSQMIQAACSQAATLPSTQLTVLQLPTLPTPSPQPPSK